jgi:ribosomal protein L37E
MSYDDPIDDEEWYNDDSSDEPEHTESGHCPECAGPVYEFTDRCPACGYWLTASDRRHLWSSESKPKWVLITAGIILVVLVLGMLTLRF